MINRTRIQGYCPMGCGRTLFVDDGGHITCSWLECPDPYAVGAILAENETGHIVTFGLNTFTVRHPLSERVERQGFDMEDCGLPHEIAALDGPPVKPGRYRATLDGASGRWSYEEIT